MRIDPVDWSLHPLIGGPLARPIDVRFDPSGEHLYVLDFGHFEMRAERGVEALAHSGKLWRLHAGVMAAHTFPSSDLPRSGRKE